MILLNAEVIRLFWPFMMPIVFIDGVYILVILQTELTSEDKRKAHQQELREQLHEDAKRRLLEAQGKAPEKKYVRSESLLRCPCDLLRSMGRSAL